MDYYITAYTDVGTRKKTNQDCCTIKTMRTPKDNAVFAVLCDGMGGLEKGELASATIMQNFSNWFYYTFPKMHSDGLTYDKICDSWENVINASNNIIMSYSAQAGMRMGSTLAAILGVEGHYYVVNVGDSRVYKIDNNRLEVLTKDHSYVAHEVEMKRMTESEARVSPQRSVLLQCIGASNSIEPFFNEGELRPDECYMLCSDGLRNTVLPNEFLANLKPALFSNEDAMTKQCKMLVDLNISRKETDNITVALIRTLRDRREGV